MRRQPTPQHITWFLDLDRNKQLDLNPSYQRKSVWTPKDRRFFLDTIFRNYPTPPVFFHRKLDDNGFTTYHVVDGKQRMETIFMFARNNLAIDKEFGDVNLDGKKFKDLDSENRRKFWDYVLIVDFIDSIEGTNIEEVFDRVNRNAKNLQPQELRHARFDGWFINETELESENKFWWDFKVSTRARDRRMKNVQLISELLLINLEKKIIGFSQDYLNEMYAKYDVPEETVDDFNLDTYLEDKERNKNIIYDMNNTNKCIESFGHTANNLYTLWALITLNSNIPDPAELANRYKHFMENVQQFISYEKLDKDKQDANPLSKGNYYDYYINSKGASTDLTQRESRYKALSTIIG